MKSAAPCTDARSDAENAEVSSALPEIMANDQPIPTSNRPTNTPRLASGSVRGHLGTEEKDHAGGPDREHDGQSVDEPADER